MISIAVAGAVWDTVAAQTRVVEYATELVGQRGAEVVRAVLASASKEHSGLAAATSIAVIAVGATAVFAELESALNTIWGVEVPPGKGVRAFVRRRLVSVVLVVGVTGLLVGSLAVSAGIAFFERRLGEHPGVVDIPWNQAYLPISLGALTLVFSACFKLLPATRISWREVWVGGATTCGLFLIGRELIGYYLARASLDSSYGAAGSLVVLLLWVYYSAVIFFLGAELTHVLSQRRRARDASAHGDAR